MPTFGFRLDDGDSSMAYIPDVEYLDDGTGDRPSNWPTASTCSSTTPITLRRSMKTRRGRGHCSDAAAVALAREAGVCKIVCFTIIPITMTT